MRLTRIFMALTVGLAVVAAPTAAGAAAPQPPVYPPTTAALTVSPTALRLGTGVFTLRGRDWPPNRTVAIHVDIAPLAAAAPAEGTARRSDGSTVAMAAVAYAKPQPAPRDFEVTANAVGNFTVTYRPTQVGRYTFEATAQTAQGQLVSASANATVLPARHEPPQGGGNLPVTGAGLSTPMKFGGGLAGTGLLLLLLSVAWRRRGRFGMGSR